jgi:DNA-binding transcriptional ArsR family regulator
MTPTELADNFSISRPAISKHIRILRESGLVTVEKHGRERYCEVKFEKLGEISDWVEQYRKFWETKLDALEEYLQVLQAKDRKHDTKK